MRKITPTFILGTVLLVFCLGALPQAVQAAPDVPGVTTWSLDIKPGGCENPLNIKSRGVLPAAILGSATFDVRTINPATVLLVVDGVQIEPIRTAIEDVATPPKSEPTCPNLCTDTETLPDGFDDLTMKFDTERIVEALGGWDGVEDGECIVFQIIASLNDGTPIAAQDVVLILKKGSAPKPPKSPPKGPRH